MRGRSGIAGRARDRRSAFAPTVERRGRFIQHHDLRFQDDRASDGNSLALAAGKFVRIAVAGGRIELHFGERFAGPPRRGRPVERPGSCTSSPSVMMSPTFMRGESEPNGSCNTICRSFRNGRMRSLSSRDDVARHRSPPGRLRGRDAAARGRASICRSRIRRRCQLSVPAAAVRETPSTARSDGLAPAEQASTELELDPHPVAFEDDGALARRPALCGPTVPPRSAPWCSRPAARRTPARSAPPPPLRQAA